MLKVKKGGAVHFKGKIYKEGSEIPSDVPAKVVEEWTKTGYVYDASDKEKTTEVPPGVTVYPSWKSDDSKVTQSKKPEPAAPKSPWTFDPDGLRGRSLDELNVLIGERDASVDPFEDLEEALAWLSQDFEEEALERI